MPLLEIITLFLSSLITNFKCLFSFVLFFSIYGKCLKTVDILIIERIKLIRTQVYWKKVWFILNI